MQIPKFENVDVAMEALDGINDLYETVTSGASIDVNFALEHDVNFPELNLIGIVMESNDNGTRLSLALEEMSNGVLALIAAALAAIIAFIVSALTGDSKSEDAKVSSGGHLDAKPAAVSYEAVKEDTDAAAVMLKELMSLINFDGLHGLDNAKKKEVNDAILEKFKSFLETANVTSKALLLGGSRMSANLSKFAKDVHDVASSNLITSLKEKEKHADAIVMSVNNPMGGFLTELEKAMGTFASHLEGDAKTEFAKWPRKYSEFIEKFPRVSEYYNATVGQVEKKLLALKPKGEEAVVAMNGLAEETTKIASALAGVVSPVVADVSPDSSYRDPTSAEEVMKIVSFFTGNTIRNLGSFSGFAGRDVAIKSLESQLEALKRLAKSLESDIRDYRDVGLSAEKYAFDYQREYLVPLSKAIGGYTKAAQSVRLADNKVKVVILATIESGRSILMLHESIVKTMKHHGVEYKDAEKIKELIEKYIEDRKKIYGS